MFRSSLLREHDLLRKNKLPALGSNPRAGFFRDHHALRRRRSTREPQGPGWSVVLVLVLVLILVLAAIEVEHIEQVADRRHVGRDVEIVGHDRVRQIVTAAAGERLQSPVSLDEFENRNVVGVAVSHLAATGERRDSKEGNARSVTEKGDRLIETGIPVTAAFVEHDEEYA